MTPGVLLVDDDEEVLEAYGETLALEGFAVRPHDNVATALSALSRDMEAVVLSDVRMPGRDGFGLLSDVMAVDPEIPVVLVSGHADVPMAIRAMKEGAYDFVEKPADPAYLVALLRRAAEHRRLVLENRRLSAPPPRHGLEGRIVGASPAAERLRDMVLSLADVDASILILGETGTGKELVARSLHEFGARRGSNFVAVNCGALPETMIESELFGHEAGAFTGAREKRIGKIEHAHKGTLFLDEIESMPLPAQVRLLRVLQERKLERIGSNKEIPVDIRVIAATKADLAAMAGEGRFREDLVYRLNVITLTLPPLRERRADVPLLFRFFHDEAARRIGPRAAPFRYDPALALHDWPGNVRELKNAAERAALGFPPLPELTPPAALASAGSSAAVPDAIRDVASLAARMAAHERREIASALERQGRRIGETAAMLGISRKTLYLKMREHGLSREGDEGAV